MYDDGPGRGSRVIAVVNDRLRFEVLPDRGLGIGLLEYEGIPLSWSSPVGPVHPHYAEYEGYGWLRTFSGGALVTCGLTQVGNPDVDHGEDLGLHGRIANVPAHHVGVTRDNLKEPEINVQGTVRETRVFGPNLVLTRRIATRLGEARVDIVDIVTNAAYVPTPFMVLYHMNFGYPLVSPSSRIVVPAMQSYPVDDEAARFMDSWDRPTLPEPGVPERCYYHEVAADSHEQVEAAIVNPDLQLGVSLVWSHKSLPKLVQWNLFASGEYVAALEPGNCWTEGRTAERARGTLVELAPGQEWIGGVSIRIVKGADSLDEMTHRISTLRSGRIA